MPNAILRPDAEALIEDQVAREIIEGTVTASAAMKMFTRMPNMTSDKTKLRVLDLLPLAYWVDGDIGFKNFTKQAWKNKWINAAEMAAIIPIPESVLDDADYDIWASVKPRAIEAFARLFDDATFTGVNKPNGFRDGMLESIPTTSQIAQTGTLYEAINDAMAAVESSGFVPTGVVGGPRLKSKFRMMLDTTGQPIKGTDIDSIPRDYIVNGAWDDSVAQMVIGDMRQAVFAIRKDVTVKLLDQAVIQDPATEEIIYNLAQQDMVALRLVMRLGWELPNPINILEPNPAVRFPFALVLPNSTTPEIPDLGA